MGISLSRTTSSRGWDLEAKYPRSSIANTCQSGRTLQEDVGDLTPAQRKYWERWKDKEYAIQPHTDAAGESYFIGDLYETPRFADEWKVPDGGPYLTYVQEISKSLPHLAYLANWMEVSASPPKWRWLRHFPAQRDERARRTNVCVIDYKDETSHIASHFDDAAAMREHLESPAQMGGPHRTSILVVEDLSRDVIEVLGSLYDIDPLFWRSQIDDYVFYNSRDPWVQLPQLADPARTHFTLQYLRAFYFEKERDFESAEEQSGLFNVLRRLDSDRSRLLLQDVNNSVIAPISNTLEWLPDKPENSVSLCRAKISIWTNKPCDNEPLIAIVLVDPTVTTGTPLWGGRLAFERSPSMKNCEEYPEKQHGTGTNRSHFEDAVHWLRRLSPLQLDEARRNSTLIALPVLKMVIAEWLIVARYMITTIVKTEWECECQSSEPRNADQAKRIAATLRKASPWRRHLHLYQSMVSNMQNVLLDCGQPSNTSAANALVAGLQRDLQIAATQLNQVDTRLGKIESLAMQGASVEESMKTTANVRLARLATLFLPLNLVAGFLSMSSSLSAHDDCVWLFFLIGTPLVVILFLLMDISKFKSLQHSIFQWVKQLHAKG